MQATYVSKPGMGRLSDGGREERVRRGREEYVFKEEGEFSSELLRGFKSHPFLLTFSFLFRHMKLPHVWQGNYSLKPTAFLAFFPLFLTVDWSHATKAHSRGLSSICLRGNGNMRQCEGREQNVEESRSRGSLGATGVQLTKTKAEGRSTSAQTWVYRITVCIWPPRSRIAASKSGVGIFAGHRVLSTGQLTLFRNAGGRTAVALIQMLMLHNL